MRRGQSFETWQQVMCACCMGKCLFVRITLLLLVNLTEPFGCHTIDADCYRWVYNNFSGFKIASLECEPAKTEIEQNLKVDMDYPVRG